MNTATRILTLMAAIAAGTTAPAFGTVVYDNTTTDLHIPSAWTALEYGDQITLAGTQRQATAFTVILDSDLPQTVDLVVRFRANDGPGGKPASVLWNATLPQLPVNGVTPVTLSLPNVTVPETFTWTVQTGTDQVGTRLYDPPNVGSSEDWLWLKAPGIGWGRYSWMGDPVANLGARVDAVPEPATMSLLAAGGLLALLRRRSPGKA